MPDRHRIVHDLHELAKAERAANPPLEDLMEKAMADDPTKVGMDSKVISLATDHDVRSWCQALGVTEPALRQSVADVGNSVEAVLAHLGKK